MNRGESHSLSLARKEWRTERREAVVYYALLSVTLIGLFLFLLVISLHLYELTGYATSISSDAGYITEVTVYSSLPVEIWGGFYGLILQVDGFTQQLSEDLESGEVVRSDIFFDCVDRDAEGGPEVYASTSSTVDLTSSDISPATFAMIDAVNGCTTQEYCADSTFVRNLSFYIGDTEIADVPSTFTYKFNGQNQIFDIGALNVSNTLVFVAHVNGSIQAGFNPDALVNYQMLLPTPANTTSTYYFYSDPYDECPAGGIGTIINASIYGYITDTEGFPIENALVSVAGSTVSTNSLGFYNLSTLVVEDTYNYVAQASGYDPHVSNVTISFANNVIEKNATLTDETPSTGDGNSVYVFGVVNDTSGALLGDVNISFGDANTTSDSNGNYNLTASVVSGSTPFIAIKTSYDNYVGFLAINATTTIVNYNFSMDPANLFDFVTGPFTEEPEPANNNDGDFDDPPGSIIEEVTQETSLVLPTEIDWQVREGTFVEKTIRIFNFNAETATVAISIPSELQAIMEVESVSVSIPTGSYEDVTITIFGTQPVGVYRGTIGLSGGLEADVPARIEIVPRKLPIATLDMNLDLFRALARPGGELKYRLILNNLLSEQGYKVSLNHLVTSPSGVEVLLQETEEVEIDKSLTLLESITFPEDFEEGEYLLNVEGSYLGLFSSVTAPFVVSQPLYLYSFFGIPLWMIFVAIGMLGFIFLNFFLYKRHQNKKKRYHLELHLDLLPKDGDRSIKVGKVAERKEDAFINMDDITTHMIVAGATGGGKSISAQVIVEEMLKKNIAVIVFDPTAQWSGMLRKCEDKGMMKFYSKFGLKPSDARGFPGSVHQVTNHLWSVDINKYVQPGQIQVFTLNKLDPSQIDTFVAGAINNIFKSDPKEHPGLHILLVFDEVHRLLPKFGGSGKGFLQIERACREFRKWGLGVMLVSQVLSDFVGEIKANINTELQMRVAEENDLERIRERYGEDALKSLVRASIGTGMTQNAEYNRGLPYFITLRPILHSTRRLTDEVLDKYNSYNERIEDLQYQIDQLEELKVDTFDLKMELKLVKDKLMTGNFTVVDIYLEGLGPRLEKQWSTLGKKPKKYEMELLDVTELEAALKTAQKERAKANKAAGGGDSGGEKKEVKADPGAKIVTPVTLNNGAMISSLNELKDVLPGLDDTVFKEHVNEEKNDIAKWVSEQVDKALGEKMKGVTDKAKIVEIASSFGKEEKKEDSKEDGAKKEGAPGSEEATKVEESKEDAPKEGAGDAKKE